MLAKNGKDASSSSAALAAGAQLEFGYQFNKNFNLNLEWSSKKSTIDAQATVFGINQPVNYSIWLHSIKLGVRYSIHQFPKISLPKMKKKSSNV